MLSTRFPFGLIFLASAAIVGTALATQYVGGLQPCELCLYERWPYYAAIVIALLGIGIRQGWYRQPAMWVIVLLFAASAGLGAYHIAVEQHWIAGPSACTGGVGGASSPDQLLQMLQSRQPVQCDVPQWSFHGLTLAGLNLIASVILLVFSFIAARRAVAS